MKENSSRAYPLIFTISKTKFLWYFPKFHLETEMGSWDVDGFNCPRSCNFYIILKLRESAFIWYVTTCPGHVTVHPVRVSFHGYFEPRKRLVIIVQDISTWVTGGVSWPEKSRCYFVVAIYFFRRSFTCCFISSRSVEFSGHQLVASVPSAVASSIYTNSPIR